MDWDSVLDPVLIWELGVPHSSAWEAVHGTNKFQAPGFYSALQNTLVQQLFVNSADEKQETKLLWTICIMSLGHISLQNSELFLAQPQEIYLISLSFLSVNYIFLPSPHTLWLMQ